MGEATMVPPLDVMREAMWIETFAAVEETHGRLDIIVDNAGITTIGSIEALEIDAFRAMLDIDLVGVFPGCKHVVPLMKRTGGSGINMSSMSGIRA